MSERRPPDPLRPHDVPEDRPAAGVRRPRLLAGLAVAIVLAFAIGIGVWLTVT